MRGLAAWHAAGFDAGVCWDDQIWLCCSEVLVWHGSITALFSPVVGLRTSFGHHPTSECRLQMTSMCLAPQHSLLLRVTKTETLH